MAPEEELQRLVVRLLGDNKDYMRMLQESQGAAMKAQSQVATASQQMSQNVAGLTKGMEQLIGQGSQLLNVGTGVIGLAGAFGTLRKSISLANELEDNEIAFKTFLKDAGKAQQLMKDIQGLAAEAPTLGTRQLAAQGKMLLQFGIEAKDIVGTLRMLGDAVGGNAQSLERVARQYGQVKSQGKAMGEEINVMIEAGFNPLKELEKMGKGSMPALKQMQSEGKITFKLLEEAFKHATAEGGDYFNAMKNQAEGLNGQLAGLTDNVEIALGNFGKTLIRDLQLKELTKQVADFSDKFGEAFNGMDERTRKTITFGAATVAAFATAAAATKVLRFAVLGLWSSLGPITIGVVAAGAAFAMFAEECGSLSKAMDGVQIFSEALWKIWGFSGTAALDDIIGRVQKLTEAYEADLAIIAATVAVVGTLVLAYKALAFMYGVLRVQQLAAFAVMLLWKGALLVAKIVTLAYAGALVVVNAAIAVFNVMTSVSAMASIAWAAAALVAKAAAWLLSAALTALSIALAPVTILASVVAITALGAAFTLVASAAYAAYASAKAVYGVLRNIEGTSEALGRIGAIFKELGSDIKLAFRALRTDADLAGDILAKSFQLAINKFKDAWPAIWNYMKYGFMEIAALVQVVFKTKLAEGIYGALSGFSEELDVLGIWTKERKAALKEVNDNSAAILKAEIERVEASLELANRVFARGAGPFKVEESEHTKELRMQLDELKKQLMTRDSIRAGFQAMYASMEKTADKSGELKQNMADTAHHASKFDAALRGSAEAAARLAEHADKMRMLPPRPMQIAPMPRTKREADMDRGRDEIQRRAEELQRMQEEMQAYRRSPDFKQKGADERLEAMKKFMEETQRYQRGLEGGQMPQELDRIAPPPRAVMSAMEKAKAELDKRSEEIKRKTEELKQWMQGPGYNQEEFNNRIQGIRQEQQDIREQRQKLEQGMAPPKPATERVGVASPVAPDLMRDAVVVYLARIADSQERMEKRPTPNTLVVANLEM